METIEQPAVLAMPFANNGTKNALPTAATGTGAASLAEGFPLLTSISIADNGVPPSRADMNGLGYVSTAYAYLMQCGGVYTYRDDVATTIGGYPLNALLWYVPTNGIPNLLRSSIANNTNNFNEDSSVIGEEGSGKPWEIVTVSPTNFVTVNTAQTITGEKTFSVSPIVPTATAGDSSTKAASTEFVTTVSSNLQTQINQKANSSSVVTLTGSQTIAGTKTFSSSPVVPTASSSDNSTKSASTAFVKNVLSSSGNGLATISKAGNGYCKFTNGLIIQWGRYPSYVAPDPQSVTFRTPFTSTNYKAICTYFRTGGDVDSGKDHINVDTQSTTGFTFRMSDTPAYGVNWVAIGY